MFVASEIGDSERLRTRTRAQGVKNHFPPWVSPPAVKVTPDSEPSARQSGVREAAGTPGPDRLELVVRPRLLKVSVLLQHLLEVMVMVTSAWEEIAPIRKTAKFRKNGRAYGKTESWLQSRCLLGKKEFDQTPLTSQEYVAFLTEFLPKVRRGANRTFRS